MNDTERKIYQDVMADFRVMVIKESEEIAFKEYLRLMRFYMHAVGATVKAIEKYCIVTKGEE